MPGPDGVDRLLLAEAEPYAGRTTVVVDDVTGSLVAGLPGVAGFCCDSLVEQRRAASVSGQAPSAWLDPALLAGAALVVARLPKGLAALDELAGAVAAHADPDALLLAGGLVRHMDRGMNDVLARHFGVVRGTLGRHKARALVASGPLTRALEGWPRCERHEDLDLTVCAHGGVFGGTGVDVGSRLLLGALDVPAGSVEVVDLGCGNGVLAATVARRAPTARIQAFDVSAAAVLSARATARANGLGKRIETVRADGLEGVEPGSVDLVVCNPPFHRGTALDRETTPRLFREAGAALRPGGQLWTVWNSHLPWLPLLRSRVGSTTVVVQTPRFTVTRSIAARSSAR